jgi:SAM-dependent methyltransferase
MTVEQSTISYSNSLRSNCQSKDTLVTPLPGNALAKLDAFPPGTFNLIITLWDIPENNPVKILKTLQRALKPKGQLILTLDNRHNLFYFLGNIILK